MSSHLSLRSGNPVLKANTFIQRHTAIDNGTMTITGTVNKTALSLLLEGLALGGISRFFETLYPGIVNQAVFLTFGTLAALLFAYRSGLIKPTENFKLGIAAATGGIFFVYIISFILGLFGVQIPLIHSNSNFGILFSFGVVVIAALNIWNGLVLLAYLLRSSGSILKYYIY